MHIVFVHINVKPECMEDFVVATNENAKNSILEPGIVRFDFFQQVDEPNRFSLVEIYKSEEDQMKHRETRHYQVWRDTVANMMAENRIGVKYRNLFPQDDNWK